MNWKALTCAAVMSLAAPTVWAADDAAPAPTREVTKTVTKPNGKEVTTDKTMTKTANGKTWTKDRSVKGAHGGTHTSHATGSMVKNADGSKDRTMHKVASGTGPKGHGHTKTVDRSAHVEKTATGRHVEKSVTKDVEKTPAPQ